MTPDITVFLIIFVITIILFSTERFPADLVAIGVVLSLILTGLLPADKAFAGFGSETVVMIFGLLVLTEGLIRTGVVDILGNLILRWVGNYPGFLTSALTIMTGITSAFMSNTATTAFYLPVALGLSRRTRTNPSKVLMPLAFASILASSVTLVATSTNVVVSGLMQQYGMEPIGMFELTPVGLPILVVGLLYMIYVGQHLVPEREEIQHNTEKLGLLYIAELIILPQSGWIGKRLEDTAVARGLGVLQLSHASGEEVAPLSTTILVEGDCLVVEGTREEILNLKSIGGVNLRGEPSEADNFVRESNHLLVEIMLMPGSPLIGRTIKGFHFRERYDMQILGLNQQGKIAHSKIGRQSLGVGDVLIVQIPAENLELLKADNFFRILDIFQHNGPDRQRARLAIGLFIGALLLATFEVVSIGVAVLIGAFLAFATRCITPEEAYRKIEWKVLIIIGSMLAFGSAMQESGTAAYLAEQIVNAAGHIPPIGILSLFFVLAVILTQPMSNQAAAAILIPIAIQTALKLDLNPRPFTIMIAVAASCSFITPLEPACVMVYGIGRYRFWDFVRVGTPLTLIIYVLAILLVPTIWHF